MDTIDEQILGILRRNARASLREIGDEVGLSTAPVKRRIDRLEQQGIIRGYQAIVDFGRAPATIEAFAEIRIPGGADVDVVLADLQVVPEVDQIFTIAGDPDILVRFRVADLGHLQRVLNQLRKTGRALGTKTMIVMEAWQRQ